MKRPISQYNDRTGNRYGDFIAIKPCGQANDGHIKWLCRCSCGNEIVVASNNLRTSKMTCQKCHNIYRQSLLEQEVCYKGKRFGRLTVIGYSHTTHTHRYFECKCDCGKTIFVQLRALNNGEKTSCGCDKPKCVIHRTPTLKGKYATHIKKKAVKLYRIYNDMHRRCEQPQRKSYEHYGGRGISVCTEWSGENGYDNFCDWSYQNGFRDNAKRGELTIDRINNDGNYEPSNCRWVSEYVQANNRRNNHVVTILGRKTSLIEACRELKIPYRLVQSRLNRGWSENASFVRKKGVSREEAEAIALQT